jgi:iron complex outermembrane recepter protein
VSKYSYNLVAIYEKYNFSARLGDNWRSRFVDSYISVSNDLPDRSPITVSPLKFLGEAIRRATNRLSQTASLH